MGNTPPSESSNEANTRVEDEESWIAGGKVKVLEL